MVARQAVLALLEAAEVATAVVAMARLRTWAAAAEGTAALHHSRSVVVGTVVATEAARVDSSLTDALTNVMAFFTPTGLRIFAWLAGYSRQWTRQKMSLYELGGYIRGGCLVRVQKQSDSRTSWSKAKSCVQKNLKSGRVRGVLSKSLKRHTEELGRAARVSSA